MCLVSGFVAFQYLLDQINSSTWSIQFVAGELIGRTGSIAKTAVYAAAQNFISMPDTAVAKKKTTKKKTILAHTY